MVLQKKKVPKEQNSCGVLEFLERCCKVYVYEVHVESRIVPVI